LQASNYKGNDPEAGVYFQGTPWFFAGVEYDQMQFGVAFRIQ